MTIEMRFEAVVSNPFATIINSQLISDLAAVQLRWAQKLQAKFQAYPAERPGQVYIRTFDLRDAWNIDGPRVTGGSISTEVSNDTPYTKYVIGDDIGNFQNRAYHAGRWALFRKEVEASEAELNREAQAVVNRHLAPAIITP